MHVDTETDVIACRVQGSLYKMQKIQNENATHGADILLFSRVFDINVALVFTS